MLNSGVMGLFMSLEFVRKQRFKLNKIERPIYKGYRERIEIDVIGGQKWSVILGMPWLACYNPDINWRIRKMKIMRYLEECGKQ